jgi:hypothetical protein
MTKTNFVLLVFLAIIPSNIKCNNFSNFVSSKKLIRLKTIRKIAFTIAARLLYSNAFFTVLYICKSTRNLDLLSIVHYPLPTIYKGIAHAPQETPRDSSARANTRFAATIYTEQRKRGTAERFVRHHLSP